MRCSEWSFLIRIHLSSQFLTVCLCMNCVIFSYFLIRIHHRSDISRFLMFVKFVSFEFIQIQKEEWWERSARTTQRCKCPWTTKQTAPTMSLRTLRHIRTRTQHAQAHTKSKSAYENTFIQKILRCLSHCVNFAQVFMLFLCYVLCFCSEMKQWRWDRILVQPAALWNTIHCMNVEFHIYMMRNHVLLWN